MTVTELYNKLGEEIAQGHGNLKVIANCRFTICRKGSEYELNTECKPELYDMYMCYLNDVYYQSGDIELAFSDEKE